MMKKCKRILCLCLTCVMLFASMATAHAETPEDDGIMPLSLTYDANVEVNGECSVLAYHYGNFQFDGRYYIENYSGVTVKYKISNNNGYVLAQGSVLPGGNETRTLYQRILTYNLSDGEYKIHFSTGDGSTAHIYFKYRVLD